MIDWRGSLRLTWKLKYRKFLIFSNQIGSIEELSQGANNQFGKNKGTIDDTQEGTKELIIVNEQRLNK